MDGARLPWRDLIADNGKSNRPVEASCEPNGRCSTATISISSGLNSESVDLIATDPPFNKGRDFHATPDSLASGAKFQDRWTWEKDVHRPWRGLDCGQRQVEQAGGGIMNEPNWKNRTLFHGEATSKGPRHRFVPCEWNAEHMERAHRAI